MFHMCNKSEEKTYLYLFCSKVFLVYHGPPCALEGEDGIAVCCCLCLKGLVLLGFCLRAHGRSTCLRIRFTFAAKPHPLEVTNFNSLKKCYYLQICSVFVRFI